ncbi:MAG: phage tail protein, partial [Deltaproteobacteria bacterium]|nr:phage tail protein [Deltaproteobacteria bacterium]
MWWIDGPDAVSQKPAKKPAASNPGYFGGGDPITNQKASMVTCDWLNMIQSEILSVVLGADIVPDRTKDDQLLAAIRKLTNIVVTENKTSFGVPVGTVITYYGTIAPDGYLACDGGNFSANDYPLLYDHLGKNTTPDLRGAFIRGLGGNSAGLGARQPDAGRNVTGFFILPTIAYQTFGIFGVEGGGRPAINAGVGG